MSAPGLGELGGSSPQGVTQLGPLGREFGDHCPRAGWWGFVLAAPLPRGCWGPLGDWGSAGLKEKLGLQQDVPRVPDSAVGAPGALTVL